MSKQRKRLSLSIVFLGLIMIVVTIPMVIYAGIKNLPNSWVGYVVMTIIDVTCAVVIIVLCIIFLPKINKIENAELETKNNFNISNLGENVKNEFEVFHSEIVKVKFLAKSVIFSKIKFSNSGVPLVKNEQKILEKRKVEFSDLYIEELEVPYSELEFSVVTNRNFWHAVPNIAVVVKLPKHIVDNFIEHDEYVLINASKELLLYVLGTENTLINSELLTEKQLSKKPKVLKSFTYSKLKWWLRILICGLAISLCTVFGVFFNSTVSILALILSAIVVICVVVQPSIKLVFYEQYFGDGIRLSTLKEITKVYLEQDFKNSKKSLIVIKTPVVTVVFPYREEVWQYIIKTLPEDKKR